MLRQSSDLILVGVAALVGAALILIAPGIAALRILSALLLLLVLPGYALSAALLPGRFLDLPQRALFALGLSLSLTVLVGLVLNQLHVPLYLNTWVMVLVGISIGLAFVAAWRRRSAAAYVPNSASPFKFRPSWREAVLLGLAVFVTGAAMQLARLPTPNSIVSGYTLLWMVPAQDGTHQLRLGLDSREFDTTRYNLEVLDNGRLVQGWSDVELKPGGSWQHSIELSAAPEISSTIEARLYRSDQPDQVYRRVALSQGEQ
jgi:hypothetical protein